MDDNRNVVAGSENSDNSDNQNLPTTQARFNRAGLTNDGNSVKSIRIFKSQVTMMLLLTFFSFLVFFDRASLPVANLLIQSDFDITSIGFGMLMTIPMLFYGFFQLCSGFVFDNFKSRYILGVSFAIWSLIQAFIGFRHSFSLFLYCRLGVMSSAAPDVMAGIKAISEWFSVRERPSAIGYYNASTIFSNAFAPILVVMFMTSYGWRFVFSVLGFVGFIAVILWFFFYKDRAAFRHTPDEHEYFFGGSNSVQDSSTSPGVSFAEWLSLFKKPLVICFIVGFGGTNFTSILYMTWLPGYLQLIHGLSLLDMGIVATIPFLFGGLGIIANNKILALMHLDGEISAQMRCKFIAVCMIISAFCTLSLAFTNDMLVLSVIFISGALFFVHSAGTQSWILLHSIVPRRIVTSVSGIQNFGGFVIASFAPITAGIAYDISASFNIAFQICFAVTFIGALSYMFFISKFDYSMTFGDTK